MSRCRVGAKSRRKIIFRCRTTGSSYLGKQAGRMRWLKNMEEIIRKKNLGYLEFQYSREVVMR